MTQNNKEINIESENSTPHKAKKKSHFLLKSFFVVILTFVCLMIYKNLQVKEGVIVKKPIVNINKDSKEDSILDISDEYRDGLENETTVHDLNISEIKEKGAEFVYQLLIKNQVQIEDINNQLRNFKGDFIKLKSREKINKLIINYVELREKLFNGEDCKSEIEGYDLLSVSDEFLQSKFLIIKEGYALFSTQKKLLESFKSITNQLIINENYDEKNTSLFEKLRHNFNKLVVIRKVKNLNPDQLEGVINQIELALSQKNYQEAMNKSLSLDKAYFPIVQKFLEELSIAIEIQNADKEIIKYLKSLT
jgi:hypothetical protein